MVILWNDVGICIKFLIGKILSICSYYYVSTFDLKTNGLEDAQE